MPGWHERTKALQDRGALQLVGLIQEQHPHRARLFMQWKQMGWPVMVDALNLLGVEVVPIALAIDEAGIIRHINPSPDELESFVAAPAPAGISAPASPTPPKLATLQARAESENTAAAWLALGDARFLWHDDDRGAIAAYDKAIANAPEDGRGHFRLGVALRRRYDRASAGSSTPPTGAPSDDFTRAVETWQRSLDLEPNHYIRRRRLQQYGPRLDKPYPFYDWVGEARAAIAKRGEAPEALLVEPRGAELAAPQTSFESSDASSAAAPKEPDPRGKVRRDARYIRAEITTVPPVAAPGDAVRVHLVFQLRGPDVGHWNNEADDLLVWLDPPDTWQAQARLLRYPRPPQPESDEARQLEVELKIPKDAPQGSSQIPAYAVYYVCNDGDGTCLYRRQDLAIPVTVRAPSTK